QWFLKQAERWAAVSSDLLVADSGIMQQYIREKYNRVADYIPYGAIAFDQPDAGALQHFDLRPFTYNMLVARMEPENNIETIIRGCLAAECRYPLVIIGDHHTRFGRYLTSCYKNEKIIFYGALYDLETLNQLRYHAHVYFHGHSVGGTNPSLLEAMASQALIVAHDNGFNRAVLGNDAYYFREGDHIAALLDSELSRRESAVMIKNNLGKIRTKYSWEHIADRLETSFRQVAGTFAISSTVSQ
ncbi:MAG TPA: glycosyltransferase, partial [Chitinophagaceae bacterium]|nr:glycosyltransferase [Chitinophagaceae bacterium]